MSVRSQIRESDGIYFITITCARWLHLFEIPNAYDAVYKWFDHLKSKRHYILGYVIMPNHLHALVGFSNRGGSINKIIGNGKRFMAYEIVEKLKLKNNDEILYHLSSFVNATDKKRNKLHEVFEPSFDWKECRNNKFIEQKLNYIHANPCRGAWKLADEELEYIHSSASYYVTNNQGVYCVTNYTELEDIDLTKFKSEGQLISAESRSGDSAKK